MQAQAVLDNIAQKPAILQAEINKIEALHRSLLVAGWRPAIGWEWVGVHANKNYVMFTYAKFYFVSHFIYSHLNKLLLTT